MTSISNKLEAPASDSGAARSGKGRSRQSQRRKRPLLRTLRRRLDKMLSMRQIIRSSVVLLPLAGFLYISLNNVVLRPQVETPASITTLQGKVASDAPTSSHDDTPSTPSTTARQTSAYASTNEPVTSESIESARSVVGTTTYTVNQGGSLWRTGRRFIDDEVVLDKLIDSLEQNGMDVRKVRAGMEFVVEDLGSEGLLVLVNDGGETYESHIQAGSVTTSVQRQTGARSELSQTAWLGE